MVPFRDQLTIGFPLSGKPFLFHFDYSSSLLIAFKYNHILQQHFLMHSAYYGTFQIRPCGFIAEYDIQFRQHSRNVYISGSRFTVCTPMTLKALERGCNHGHGKTFFLRLAADLSREVNMVRETGGSRYSAVCYNALLGLELPFWLGTEFCLQCQDS